MRDREVIIACVVTLMLVGLVTVYSNTAVSCGTRPLENRFLCRQATWALLSLAALVGVSQVDYHQIGRHGRLLLLVTLAGLAALLFFGTRENGARRWFRFGPFSLQVAEFAKIAAIVYVADFVSRKREILRDFWRGFVPPVLLLSVVSGLILVQPDFGTAVLILAVGLTLLLASGVRWSHAGLLAAVGGPAMFGLLVMKEYRRLRLIAFLDPWADPQGTGYHVVQSLIALGSGGLTGVGPGRGLQKLGFLPEVETDFAFASFGQETGFVGCVLLLTVYAALFYAGMRVVRAAPDALGAVLALGVTVLIGGQMLINVAVATSAMPTKGIPLPFVSSGGSSLLALSLGVGILLNVSRHVPDLHGPRPLGATPKGGAA
jgi:cell division protein FtsW